MGSTSFGFANYGPAECAERSATPSVGRAQRVRFSPNSKSDLCQKPRGLQPLLISLAAPRWIEIKNNNNGNEKRMGEETMILFFWSIY